VVALLERAIGARLEVTYDRLGDLRSGKATPLVPGEETYGGQDLASIAAMLGVSVVEQEMMLQKESRLNDRFPEIKTKSIGELIAEAWSGK
jgi:hypothetical protein